MARAFPNDTSNLRATGGTVFPLPDPRPLSVSMWWNDATTSSVQNMLFTNVFNNASHFLFGQRNGTATTANLFLYSGGSADSTSYSRGIGVWRHVGVTWDVGNAVAFYINGGPIGTGAVARAGNTAGPTSAIGSLDGTTTFNSWGFIAEVGAWNVILTAEDMALLGKGFAPNVVKPQNLVGYWPIHGSQNPEPDLGSRDRSLPMTMFGAAGQANHPRITYRESGWDS